MGLLMEECVGDKKAQLIINYNSDVRRSREGET